MSLGTMTSRILGLFRDIAMAALFDRAVTDAWTAAFRLPNLFRRLFGEGSLSVSFIPVFLDVRNRDLAEEAGPTGDPPYLAEVRAHNLVNSFYVLLLGSLTVLTLLGLVWMEPLLRLLLDSSYTQDRAHFLLTLQMARIMFGFIFFVVSYAYFMGILQALGEFAWPAFAPALFNITMLVFTFMPGTWFAAIGDGLAWGVLAGGFLQAAVLIPILRRKNYFPAMQWSGFSPELRKILSRFLPGVLGLGVMQLVTLVNLHFASSLGEGVLSAIYWADRLLELPLSLVAVSLGTAMLPHLSDLWSRGEKEKLLETSREQIILSGFWLVPAAIGLFMLARPIVETLFLRGAFSGEDLLRTTQVLRIYAGSLITLSLVRLLLPMLYAAHLVWWPALCALVALVMHLIAAPILMRAFGLQGLILSTLMCTFANFIFLAALIFWKIGRESWGRVSLKYLQFVLISVPMALCPWIYFSLQRQWSFKLISLALAIGFGVVSYAGLGRLFKIHPMFDWRNLRASLRR